MRILRKRNLKRSRWNSYCLEQSPFYGLRSKRKLTELLKVDLRRLRRIAANRDSYIIFTTNGGTAKEREIQHPHSDLAIVHSRLFDLLRRIHRPEYLKSGVRGESQITNAHAHNNPYRGFKFDIQSFYPSVTRSHVFSCFYHMFQMSPDVADLLADICTVDDKLPTGSQLSGDMAFLANWQMFSKLEAIAIELELNFTVYVDDITVSGKNATRRILDQMVSVVKSHGYRCHKEVIFRSDGVKEVTGIILANGSLRLPHRRHQRLYHRLQDLDRSRQDIDFVKVARSVIGMMEAIDQIHPRYEIRKRQLRQEIAAR